jgi:hypothetical protein
MIAKLRAFYRLSALLISCRFDGDEFTVLAADDESDGSAADVTVLDIRLVILGTINHRGKGLTTVGAVDFRFHEAFLPHKPSQTERSLEFLVKKQYDT